MTCPVCNRDVPVTDGIYGIHSDSGLNRCEGSNRAVEASDVSEPEPKKAAPRKKAPAKK